jgi:membrane protein YdbS with pleckstrin-like domain
MATSDTADPGARQASTPDVKPLDPCATAKKVLPTNETSDREFLKLDHGSIVLSRLVNTIVLSVIGVAALASGSILIGVVPPSVRLTVLLAVLLVWFVLAVMSIVNVVWWARWEHDRWSYRVGSQVLELRHGVIWRVSVCIPLSRLQHVDLHRGPLERKFGLAALEIHTAGTRDASHRIPGLDVTTAGMLRDQLIDAAHRVPHAPEEE